MPSLYEEYSEANIYDLASSILSPILTDFIHRTEQRGIRLVEKRERVPEDPGIWLLCSRGWFGRICDEGFHLHRPLRLGIQELCGRRFVDNSQWGQNESMLKNLRGRCKYEGKNTVVES